MAQKITLSIPDMLHEKLSEWRSSFNFSKLFQEALTEAIEKKENFQKRFSQEMDMSHVIQRLKEEKLNWGRKYFDLGKKEAMGWVKTARYETLLYVTAFEKYYDILFDPKMNTYFKQIYETAGLNPYSALPAGETGAGKQVLLDHDKQFIEGWFNGVLEFWNQVKDKL